MKTFVPFSILRPLAQQPRRPLATLLLVLVTCGSNLAQGKIITVNTADNGDFSPGQTNLVTAIRLLEDGDSIHFAIPGAGARYLQTPPDGYPLITRNNITIDGYSQQQPGSSASPNTAGLHATNNAQLKICLTSTNGNALSMYSACAAYAGTSYPNFGFGDSEQAVLGFFRASNVWVKGIAFLAAPSTSTSQAAGGDCKTICFAVDAPDVSAQTCQGFHVSGCWFGVDPESRQVAFLPDGTTVATPAICIATYRTGTNGTPGFPDIANQPGPGTVGVAAGSANPRAEFNVFVTGYGFDSQGGPFRISGNYWGVLPDGTTLGDVSVLNNAVQQGDAFVEFGGSQDILIGTDGDGVNDAEEGNLFGAYNGGGLDIYFYGSQGSTMIAGNTFGVDIHGNSFNVGPYTKLVHHLNRDNGHVRFGSDFDGLSDALEGNTVVDSILFDLDTGQKNTAHWLSMRGNSLVNTMTPAVSRPPLGDGQTGSTGMDTYTNFIDATSGTLALIPVISPATTTATLVGSCGQRAGSSMRVVLDLYEADPTGIVPQGKKWLAKFAENSTADANKTEGFFSFNIAGLGIAHGTPLTVAATYIIDPPAVTSVQWSGGATTLRITGGAPPYDVYGATTVNGSYTLVATTSNNAATFASPQNMSFYKVVYHPQLTSGAGQTSPFSDVFSVP